MQQCQFEDCFRIFDMLSSTRTVTVTSLLLRCASISSDVNDASQGPKGSFEAFSSDGLSFLLLLSFNDAQ